MTQETLGALQTISAQETAAEDLESVERALDKVPSHLAAQLQNVLKSVRNGMDINILAQDKELTPNEASTLLQVSRPHVMALIQRGELLSQKVGRDHRIPQSEVLNLMDRKARASRDVAEAFARRDVAKHSLIASGIGVDPEIARELGF